MIPKDSREDSTTVIIRRRLRHWRTTLAGVVGMLGPIAALIWPEYALKILSISSAINGAGLVAAPDSKNTDK
jgi:hypothetical protein